MSKRCTTCKDTKPLTDFYSDRTRGDGRQVRCKPCERKIRQAKREANPVYYMGEKLVKYFKGMTYEQAVLTYNEILKSQNGVCAICKEKETELSTYSGLPRRLCVDHCHTTGKIRGLLCKQCNAGLGNFKDNTVSITNAITYLRSA